MPGTVVTSNLLGAIVIALFLGAVAANRFNESWTAPVAALAWATFAAFWANLIEHFAFTQQSIIEGVLAAVAVPVCLYVAVHAARGTHPVPVLTRAVAIMGLVYFPVTAIPVIRTTLIETVAQQVYEIVRVIGYDPALVTDGSGVRNTFVVTNNGNRYETTVVLACTGIGSMTIIAGLIAAVRAPLSQKVVGIGVTLPLIWILNLARVAFIMLAHSYQWFQIFVDEVMWLFGETNPHAVSYLIADRIIAQSLSVIALIALIVLLTRIIPGMYPFLLDLFTLVTGEETDTQDTTS